MIELNEFIRKIDDLINYNWELYFFQIAGNENYASHKVYIKEDLLKDSFIKELINTQKDYIETNIESIEEFSGDNKSTVITVIPADNEIIEKKLNNLKTSIDNSDSFNLKNFPKTKVGYVLVGTKNNNEKVFIIKKSNPVHYLKNATLFAIDKASKIESDIVYNKNIQLSHYFDCINFDNNIYSEKNGIITAFGLESEAIRKKSTAINNIISKDIFDNLSLNDKTKLFKTRNFTMFLNFSQSKLDDFVNNIAKRRTVCNKLNIQLSSNNKLILDINDSTKALQLMDYFCGRVVRDLEDETILHANNPQKYENM